MVNQDGLRAARAEKFDAWFKNRRWRVCTEASGDREQEGARFRFHRGFFLIDKPHQYRTPLGHVGRAGYLIQEVDAAGNDLPGEPQSFGRLALEHAVEQYGCVSGLPERDPRRRSGVWVD